MITRADQMDSTVITTQAHWLMHDWQFTHIGEQYVLSSEWDDRWRTSGRLEEVIEEAHRSPEWVLQGIKRFSADRERRLDTLRNGIEKA